MATPSADRVLWPPQGSIFDLTLHFEETFLDLIPSSVVIASAPILIIHCRKNPVYVKNSPLLWAKLAAVAALVGIHVAILASRASLPGFRTETSLPAVSVDLLAAVAIGAIIFTEHRHAIRSSAFVAVYLLIDTLFDICRSRSFFKRPGLDALGALAACSAGVRVVLLALEEIPKRRWFLDANMRERLRGESISGYWARSLFLYLNPMLLTGFRTVLGLQNLDHLSPEYSSSLLHEQLKDTWRSRKTFSKNSLFYTCIKVWKSLFFAIFVPRLSNAGLNFAQPFLLYRIILIVGQRATKPRLQEKVMLLLATIVVFVTLSLCRTAASHMKNGLVTCFRGGIIALLLDKSLDLPQQEGRKSAVLTLMSTDIDTIAAGVPQIHELFVTVLEVGLGVYFLSLFVGESCYAVLIPLVMSTVVMYFLGKWMASRNKTWNKTIETRVAKTSRILGQLTAIKMFGLGTVVETHLQSLREVEMSISRKFRNVQAAANIPILFADLITPVVVIAAALFWDTFDGQMSAANVFPSLSIIALVKAPLMSLLGAYSTLTTMMSSFRRIQNFLLLQEREDPREFRSGVNGEPVSIQFVRAKIAPLGTKIPILRDVNLKLRPGSISGVLGPTGSGKSLFLQSMLGEVELIDGHIYSEDEYAGFCGECVWLNNTSIKNNIIGPREYDERLFRRVVKCCLLDQDIARLPGGIDYIVGTGGAKLSGGQRQRVALARTLYARLLIVLLDNVFSSLDRKTAVSILFRLCGEDGFFKEHGITAVLSSYLPEVLDVVDQMLVLDGNGHVKVDSNLNKDESREEYIATMNAQENRPSEDQEAKEAESIRRSQERQLSPTTLSPDKENTCGKSSRSLYHLYFSPIGIIRTVMWSLSMLIVSAGEVAPEVYMRIWIELDPENNLYFIGYAGIGTITCILFAVVYAVQGNYLTPRVGLSLHHQLVSAVVGGTVAFLGGTDKGVLINRFSQDMTLIVRTLPFAFMRTIYVFWTVVIQTGIVSSGGSYMATAIPVIILGVYLIQRFYLRTSIQMRALDLETKSPLYKHFEETASGIVYIRGFGWDAVTLTRGFLLLDDSQKAFYYMACIQQWLNLVIGLLIAALASILVAFTLFLSDSTSETAVGLAFLNLICFGETLERFIHAWTSLETSIGALERLQEFMEKTPQESTRATATVPENWPSMGNIELRCLSAQYSEDVGQESVLNQVSLTIDAGQRVGLIGRTGSGKSSLFMTLLGFLRYTGVAKIDGINVSSITPNTLRSRIITISQDQIRLEASVRVNLLPFTLNAPPIATLDEKEQADAEKKDIELRELLLRLGIWSHLHDKNGLDTMLEDAGYSHGEMQLFCLARGVLRYKDTGSKVVLMDEATSGVGPDRERSAQEVLVEAFPDCSIIVIGHSKSSIRGVDFTVELSDGKVVHINPNPPDSDNGES